MIKEAVCAMPPLYHPHWFITAKLYADLGFFF